MTLFKEQEKRLVNINIKDIAPNNNQPRKSFDEYELYRLSESIRINGIIQPLTVRKCENGYLLIAGERRLKAAKAAGLKKVPCIVVNVNGQTAAVYSIIENLQRADLTLFEQAEGINRLINDYGISQLEAAERLGIAQSTLSNKLRILRLNVTERERITAAHLTERHARALIRIENENSRCRILDKVIAENMSAKECEDYIDSIVNPKRDEEIKKPTRKSGIADVRLFSNSLNRLIDTMVAAGIKASRKKQENKDYIEYRIRIQKQPKAEDESSESPQLKIC